MESSGTLNKTLLRAKEAASVLGISIKSVYRLYSKGILQGVKFRRSIRILGESVLRLKQARDKSSPKQEV